ncbi:MAG TPA: cyclic nucleotide-binding domain-containing protein [Kamptonema sp.]|nr:cyclic nucleotide-binding domain-containing protein [Kamptonema sp.]
MIDKISESKMHHVRLLLTGGWFLLIFSLFYDPISSWFTEPNNTLSPLRVAPEICVKVQGVCMKEDAYSLGAPIFWGVVIPLIVFMLLVFGHEAWRRICPLSFLSQIPRALGKQRQNKIADKKTGKIRYELAKVKKDSWLAQNHLYLQFGLLYLGLCLRILIVNSDRVLLGIFLILTILCAIAVGYLYGGKSWCQYFCPMSPVQKIFSEPRGVFNSQAHFGDRQTITQSMCRTIGEEGKEQSACVACKSPCIDIDAERSYWDGITKADRKFLYYGYLGLVIGFFVYSYLFAGNWDYYFSGNWAHQDNQLSGLFKPGFYIFGKSIPIPKIVAAPLTLAGFCYATYFLGQKVEKMYKAHLLRNGRFISQEQIQHQIFTLCTFISFNFFFVFGGRQFTALLIDPIEYVYNISIVILSTVWLYRTWGRNQELYLRESLASRLRKQLSSLKLNISKLCEGRSLEDLNPDEIYVLAKILPDFTREKRLEAYKGVLKEAIEEGWATSSSSLEVLQQMRIQLEITDSEHATVLAALGVEDPELLNPEKQRSRENVLRLESYRKALGKMISFHRRRSARGLGSDLLEVVEGNKSLDEIIKNNPKALKALKRQYAISWEEEEQILAEFDRDADQLRKANILLHQLQTVTFPDLTLSQPLLPEVVVALRFLRLTVEQQQWIVTRSLLEILECIGLTNAASNIARRLSSLKISVLPILLKDTADAWEQRLKPQIISLLKQSEKNGGADAEQDSPKELVSHLEALVQQPEPIIQIACLYVLYYLDFQRSKAIARQLLSLNQTANAFVEETAQKLTHWATSPESPPATFKTVEKLVCLLNSEFLRGMKSETLIDLAYQGQVKSYGANHIISDRENPCQGLLCLWEGEAQIRSVLASGETIVESFLPGQTLNEIEFITYAERHPIVLVTVRDSRFLEIPTDTFEFILSRDNSFARRVFSKKNLYFDRNAAA